MKTINSSPNPSTWYYLIAWLLTLASFLLKSGCGLGSPVESVSISIPTPTGHPVSIVILVDRSGSGEQHRIPQEGLSNMTVRVLDRLRVSGGQLAVSIIDGAPDKQPMCTCHLKAPQWPELPAKPQRSGARSDLAFRQAMRAYQTVDIPALEREVAKIRQGIEERIGRFTACLEQLDQHGADTTATDIATAIDRAQHAHEHAPSECVAKHTIVCGDGLSTNETIPTDTVGSDISYWCAWCTQKSLDKGWNKHLAPHMTSDLDVTLDIIFSQSNIDNYAKAEK